MVGDFIDCTIYDIADDLQPVGIRLTKDEVDAAMAEAKDACHRLQSGVQRALVVMQCLKEAKLKKKASQDCAVGS